ncbi:MAG: ATP-binding protein [Candidatus Azobacteroides sp.]|nr:ATP-binding protein [Candidatus Azobacteroides sp.]
MKKSLLLIKFLGLFFPLLFSQPIYFEHIGVLDGLSQISVLSIYQDKLGYMWFGTREGLNRYDGKDIRVILSEENDEFGLSSNIINTIYGEEDELYIHCGYHQLVRYDIIQDKFTMIDDNCQHIAQGEENMWIASRNILKHFNYASKELSEYYVVPEEYDINCLFVSSNKKLYIGTDKGLCVLDENKVFNRMLNGNIISCVYEDSRQNIWVGTNGQGVYKIKRNGLADHYSASGMPGFHLSNDIIRAFCEDNFGQIWIATFDGLNRLTPETGTIIISRNINNKPTELSHNSIHTLYKDKQGTIWVGTYFGGVNFYNPESNIYTYYYPEETHFKSVNFPIVGQMTEDKNGNLWICTEGGGLNFFDRKENKFTYYKAGEGNCISHNNLKCIWYNEANHRLYIGTHMGGLNIYDIEKNTFRHFTTSTSEKLPNNIVECIIPYMNKLLVLTQKGIVQLDMHTEKIEPFFRNMPIEKETGYDITNLYIDRNQNLWLAMTEGGLLKYNLQTKFLSRYTHSFREKGTIGRQPVCNMYETSEGELLFATLGSGLFEYIAEKDNFACYTEENNGLLSNFIYQIQETHTNYILLLTNNGLNLLDKKKKSLYVINDSRGFPLEKMNVECGCFVTRDGEIFVGGINGMASFFEHQITTSEKDYDLFFSDLYVNNVLQKASDPKAVIPVSLPYLDKIRLRHNQTNINIRFATSNHLEINKIPFEYKLTGFDDNWLPVKGQDIQYSNLRPGNYTLHVREKLENHILRTPKEITLNIGVKPPFYASPLAFILYLTLVGFIIWFIIHSNKLKFKLKTSLEYEIRENNRIQELNQAKLQFFTNISHEFRTPLTLIIGQIESLLQMDNLQANIHSKLSRIHKNASHLRELISELLDFRKQERDLLELKVHEMNIVEFCRGVFNSFKKLAAKRQIEYVFFSSENRIMAWFDPLQLQKVIYNLFSNAFKYSEDKSSILMKVEKKNNKIIISIIDSGIGIGEEDLPKIFDRFYQGKTGEMQYNPGTGIGLALAKGIIDLHHGTISAHNNPDRGTTFKVELLTGSEHFTIEERTASEGSDWDSFRDRNVPRPSFFEEIRSSQTGEHSSSNEATILIVEDNEEVLDFLDEVFSPIYRVETAKDGFEGLEKVKAIQPDIVLSDIMMPKMSGKEMCIKMKSNFETSHIPVILITADTSEEQNLEGLMAGADDYITKPFNVKALISRCNNLVLSRKRMQERYSKQIDNSALTIATTKQDQKLLNRATEVVSRYLDDPEFNVNTFAQEMALGRSKLYLKIKGITGLTPNEFILNTRLKKAASLLISDHDMNISDITHSLGFSTPRYFSKCFKDLFGISPLNYRKKNGITNNTVATEEIITEPDE